MSKRKKPVRGRPGAAGLSFSERVVVRDFARWMHETEQTVSDPSQAKGALERLIGVTAHTGVNLFAPNEISEVLEVLSVIEPQLDDELLEALVDVYHDFLHFHIDTEAPGEWVEAHLTFEEEFNADEDGDELERVLGAIEGAALELDSDVRRNALAEVGVVAGVKAMLAWIGKGRPITTTGAIRRADIAEVAAMIGLHVKGVARIVTPTELDTDDQVVLVQSMWEYRPLAVWWSALEGAELIEIAGTRVRHGRAADAWLDTVRPTVDRATEFAERYMVQVLTHPLTWLSGFGARTYTRLLIEELLAAAAGEVPDRLDADDDWTARVMRSTVQQSLDTLVTSGLLTSDATVYRVPVALGEAFSDGVYGTLSMAAYLLEDLDGFDESDEDFPDDEDDEDGVGAIFRDPQVRAEMARLGIAHKPGMAAEMMAELAPLLAEDGIDLDNLGEANLIGLDAAMQRAAERRNLELFTPVGERRLFALEAIRLMAEALASGNTRSAEIVFASIHPDATGSTPTPAEVIGVGLGLLDTWQRDPGNVGMIRTATVPQWDAGSMRAARDVLRVVRLGGAFADLQGLHLRHGGKLVMSGTLLAIAGVIQTIAVGVGDTFRGVMFTLIRD